MLKEELQRSDQSCSSVASNYKPPDGKLCPHLHLISVETHQPLNSDPFACARVVDVLSFLQAALIHSDIRQLTKPTGLLKRKKKLNKDRLLDSYLTVALKELKS